MKFLRLFAKVIIVALIILTFSIIKLDDSLPGNSGLPKNTDKIVHGIMYFVFCLVMLHSLFKTKNYRNSIWFNFAIALITSIIFGGVIELIQKYLLLHRSGDWLDFAANTTGIITACICYAIVFKSKTQKNQSTKGVK